MAGWMDNTIMTWDGIKVTDHGRGSLSESPERIGIDKRMADGTLRRQHIVVKRKWSVSWENLPSTNKSPRGMKTADGGMAGEDIERFYFNSPGKVRMVLRRGSAIGLPLPVVSDTLLPYEDDNFYIADIMFTEYTKEVIKRGYSDLWNVSVSMEEV